MSQDALSAMAAEGRRHAAEGADETALAAFRQTIATRPGLRDGWQGAFACLVKLGRGAEARQLADGWMRALPGDRIVIASALFDLGMVMRARAALNEAAKCIQQSRRIAPELPSSQLPPWAH